jgi:hypothetical protein
VVVPLAIPLTMEECSSFSTSLPASAVTWDFDLSHSDWYELESQGCFDLCDYSKFVVSFHVEHPVSPAVYSVFFTSLLRTNW